MAGRRSTASGDETRRRLMDAAMQTLREEGYVGTSARAIARRADCNQALIFYHFGGVPELLLAALEAATEERKQAYQQAFAEVGSLAEVVAASRRMHEEDVASGAMQILPAV